LGASASGQKYTHPADVFSFSAGKHPNPAVLLICQCLLDLHSLSFLYEL
jgi:hypothetical protein